MNDLGTRHLVHGTESKSGRRAVSSMAEQRFHTAQVARSVLAPPTESDPDGIRRQAVNLSLASSNLVTLPAGIEQCGGLICL
jgi:hypothetical protein